MATRVTTDSRVYLSTYTGTAEQGGGEGQLWTVVLEGFGTVMASTLDKAKALAVLDDLTEKRHIPTPQIMWNGDACEFVPFNRQAS